MDSSQGVDTIDELYNPCFLKPPPQDKRDLLNVIKETQLNLVDEEFCNAIRCALEFYVPVYVSVHADEKERRFMKKINERLQSFLEDENKSSLVILGDSGSGKTTTLHCIKELVFGSSDEFVPLYIALGRFKSKNPDTKNLVKKKLQTLLDIDDIDVFKKSLDKANKKLLFLFDAYDELKEAEDIFSEYNLEEWKDSKLILSCRFQYASSVKEFNRKFVSSGDFGKLDTVYICQFDDDQIMNYFEKYSRNILESEVSGNEEKNYYSKRNKEGIVDDIRDFGIISVVRTPYTLFLTADILPNLVSESLKTGRKVTKADIYSQFVKKWFRRESNRVDLSDISAQRFEKLASNLAFEMINKGRIVIKIQNDDEFKSFEDDNIGVSKSIKDWNKFLGERKKKCPLLKRKTDNSYSFIHKSYLEYFYSVKLYLDLERIYICSKEFKSIKETLFSLCREDKEHHTFVEAYDSFNHVSIVNDPEIISFLVDMIYDKAELKRILLEIVLASKDRKVNIAAANAITILNYTDYNFSLLDLSGVSISGSNLSGAIMDKTLLRNCDLSDVNFSKCWLRGVDLSYSVCNNIEFGERPFFKLQDCFMNIDCFRFSNDSNLLAVGTSTKRNEKVAIVLWNVQKSVIIDTIYDSKFDKKIINIIFSPDSTILICVAFDTVLIFQLNEKKVIKTVSSVHCVFLFLPSDELLYTKNDDYSNKVFSLNYRTLTESEKYVLPEITENMTKHDPAFTDMIKYVGNGVFSYTVRGDADNLDILLFKCLDGKYVGTFPFKFASNQNYIIAVSPNVKYLVVSYDLNYDQNFLEMWDIHQLKRQFLIRVHNLEITTLSFSPDSKIIASGSEDRTFIFTNTKNGKRIRKVIGEIDDIRCVQFSPNGKVFATTTGNEVIKLWDTTQEIEIRRHGHKNFAVCMCYVEEENILITGAIDNSIKVWDLKNRTELKTIPTIDSYVYGLSLHNDLVTLVSLGYQKDIKLFDLRSGKLLKKFSYTCEVENSIFLVPNTEQLVCLTNDNYVVHMISISSGKSVWEKRLNVRVWSITQYNQQTWCGGANGHIYILDLQTGRIEKTLTDGHDNWVRSICFSKDEKMFASVSKDQSIIIRETTEFKIIKRIKVAENLDFECSIHFSPSGKCISLSNVNSLFLNVYDVSTGEICNSIKSLTSFSHYFVDENTLLAINGESIQIISNPLSKKECYISGCLGRTRVLNLDGIKVKNVRNLSASNHRLIEQHYN